MRKLASLICVALLGFLFVGQNSAEARPQYLKAFLAKYPAVKEAATVKCGVCHPETDKKIRNEYGNAVGKGVGEKNQKDEGKIDGALAGAEKEKSGTDGKTFGDLLKDGKLPK
jgi:hypothetical protein